MKYIISKFILFSVFALFLSCGSEPKENFKQIKIEKDLLAEIPPQVSRSENKTDDFSKSFSGNINNKYQIEMILIKDGSNLTGKYNYSRRLYIMKQASPNETEHVELPRSLKENTTRNYSP